MDIIWFNTFWQLNSWFSLDRFLRVQVCSVQCALVQFALVQCALVQCASVQVCKFASVQCALQWLQEREVSGADSSRTENIYRSHVSGFQGRKMSKTF